MIFESTIPGTRIEEVVNKELKSHLNKVKETNIKIDYEIIRGIQNIIYFSEQYNINTEYSEIFPKNIKIKKIKNEMKIPFHLARHIIDEDNSRAGRLIASFIKRNLWVAVTEMISQEPCAEIFESTTNATEPGGGNAELIYAIKHREIAELQDVGDRLAGVVNAIVITSNNNAIKLDYRDNAYMEQIRFIGTDIYNEENIITSGGLDKNISWVIPTKGIKLLMPERFSLYAEKWETVTPVRVEFIVGVAIDNGTKILKLKHGTL